MEKILYCEDNRLILEDIGGILRKAFGKQEVALARNIAEALEAFQRGKLEAVATDGELLNGNTGWDLADKLKEMGYKGPVIYVGGTDIPETKKDRFHEVLKKPFNEKRLIEVIRNYLKQ